MKHYSQVQEPFFHHFSRDVFEEQLPVAQEREEGHQVVRLRRTRRRVALLRIIGAPGEVDPPHLQRRPVPHRHRRPSEAQVDRLVPLHGQQAHVPVHVQVAHLGGRRPVLRPQREASGDFDSVDGAVQKRVQKLSRGRHAHRRGRPGEARQQEQREDRRADGHGEGRWTRAGGPFSSKPRALARHSVSEPVGWAPAADADLVVLALCKGCIGFG